MNFEVAAARKNAQVMAVIDHLRADLAQVQWNKEDTKREIEEIQTKIDFNPHLDEEDRAYWRGIQHSMENDFLELAREEGSYWNEIAILRRTLMPTTPYFKRD